MGNVGVYQFVQLKKDFGLIDAFRCKKGEFSWEGIDDNRKILCRLDRFYVSKNLGAFISSVIHEPVLHNISDHLLVYCLLII